MPTGTTASAYLPEVDAAEVIALADRMYPSHRLEAIEAHAIQCKSGRVPLPPGTGRYAGLIARSLPPAIRKGESFDAVVRQIHDRTVSSPLPRYSGRLAGRALRQPQKAGKGRR